MKKKLFALMAAALLAALIFPPVTAWAKWVPVEFNDDHNPISWRWVPDETDTGEPVPFKNHIDENGNFISAEEARFGAYNSLNGTFTQNGVRNFSARIGMQEQGVLAQAAFEAARPAGWQKACDFNITLDGKTDSSAKSGQLFVRAPARFQKAGRQFKVMGMDADGNVVIFDNLNTVPFNVTSDIEINGFAFELIYMDTE